MKAIGLVLMLSCLFMVQPCFSGCVGNVLDKSGAGEELQAPFDDTPLNKTAMIVSPHPDDGEIFAGGSACAHINDLGDKVVEIFMTSGDAGSDLQGRTGADLAAVREGEAQKATSIIGISEILFMRFPDGGLLYNETTFDAVKGMIEKYRPYVIYTAEYLNPTYQHPDHMTSGLIVYDVVESLNWKERPIIRYFDYVVKTDANNAYVDVTAHIPTKSQAIMEYQSQPSSAIPGLAALPATYAANAALAGKPGSLCEGFREVVFAQGRNVIFDFNGIANPSSSSKAWFKNTERADDNMPPTSGPVVEGATEFTTPMYQAIYKSDDIRMETAAYLWKRVQNFKIEIGDPSQISEIYVRWEGYGKPNPPAIYAWNFNAGGWELMGSLSGDSEGYIEKTYGGSVSDYLDGGGAIYLAAITSTNGVMDALGLGSEGNKIDTDYLKVRATFGGEQ